MFRRFRGLWLRQFVVEILAVVLYICSSINFLAPYSFASWPRLLQHLYK